jgi:hypothetical protein
MQSELWIHETRRCGRAALSLPLVCAVVVVVASLLAAQGEGPPGAVAAGMIRLVADVFPMTVGMAAVTALSRERAVELQVTLPMPYALTVLRRLALLAAVTTVAATGVVVWLVQANQWDHPARGPLSLLVPLGPAALLIGTAALAGVVLRSAAAASAIVLGTWLMQVIVLDRILGTWQLNRVLLGLGGVALTLSALGRCEDGERLIQGETE